MTQAQPYKPTWPTMLLLLVFGLTPYVLSYRSVQTAADAQQDARKEAEAGKVEVLALRKQLDCRSELNTALVIAQTENASAQDDLLLGAYRQQDITARVQALIEAQKALQEVKVLRAETLARCG